MSAASAALPSAVELDRQLAEELAAFAWDPLGFVFYAYPWDTDETIRRVKTPEPWASRYDSEYGPDGWECEFLEAVGEQVRENGFDGGAPVSPVRGAITSGHGIGKGATTAHLANWILSTRPRARGVVTANTGEQLRTKTWAELTKWTGKLINAHWWEVSPDLWLRHRRCPLGWRLDGITWKKERSEAFAGLHEASSTPFYLFDEGSAIDDGIYEVAEGGLTDGEPMIFIFGNPTRNEGRFHRIFHRDRHRWIARQIDSRDVQITNKRQLEEWVEDYGEDSDFVRVRVRGVFPRIGENQFIPTEVVESARRAPARMHHTDPVVLGVDVARGGAAESVICTRVGYDARTVPWLCLRLDDTMTLVGHLTRYVGDLRLRGLPLDRNGMPSAIFVDIHGLGAGVYDRLKQLGYPVIPAENVVDPGERDYARSGYRWWGLMKEWLAAGGAIPDDEVLAQQLEGRRIKRFDNRNRVVLETKDEMAERGLESPDRADALAMTFTQAIPPRDVRALQDDAAARAAEDYNPYA